MKYLILLILLIFSVYTSEVVIDTNSGQKVEKVEINTENTA